MLNHHAFTKSLTRFLSAGLTLTILLSACGNLPVNFNTPTPAFTPTPIFTATSTPDPAILVAEACQGKAIAGAAEYSTDHNPHPMIVISPSGERHEWNAELPQEWQPYTLDQVEVVACLSEEKETVIETCTYLPFGSARRTQYNIDIRLVKARTGEELTSISLSGGPPLPLCPSQISVDLTSGTAVSVYGTRVDIQTIIPQLEPYVAAAIPPQILKGSWDAIDSLTLSPDGTILALGSCETPDQNGRCSAGTVQLWDLKNGQPLQILHGHSDWVMSVAFSPDGRTLASGSCAQKNQYGTCLEGEIILWDPNSGQVKQTLQGDTGMMVRLAYSPNGKMLASADQDGKIIIWDTQSSAIINRMQAEVLFPCVNGMEFSPDSQLLAAGGCDNKVTFWDPVTAQPLKMLEHPTGIFSLAFSPDGKTMAVGSCPELENHICRFGAVYFWDTNTGQKIHMLGGYSAAVNIPKLVPLGSGKIRHVLQHTDRATSPVMHRVVG